MEQQAHADAPVRNRWNVLLSESAAKAAGTLDAGSSVGVTALSDPDGEGPHCLLELSPATLRLMGDKPLAPNELIAVELPHHLVLADVKRCAQQGNLFTTEAARIVTIPKTAALETAAKSAKIDALIGDLHLQCHVQLSTLERSIASLDVRVGGLDPVDRRERLAAHLSQSPVPPEPMVDDSVATVNSLNLVPTPNAVAVPAAESTSQPHPRQDEPTTFAEHMALLGTASTAAASIDMAPFDTAVIEPAAKRPRKRRWSIPAALAAAVAVLALSTPLAGPLHLNFKPVNFKPVQPLPTTIEPLADAAVQTAPANALPPNVAIPAPVPPGKGPRPQPAHEVAQEVTPALDNASAVLHASIKATDPSWVSVCYDGKERFQKMFAPGETREIYFSQLALVRLGNGPATEVALGGKSIQPDGPPGVVRAVELDHGGVRFVNYRANSPACGNIADAASSAALTTHE